jgi:uncharacterized protein Yka (UPF0111/DUF47 family)
MARDKLITIRIEGDKRDAFNQLAKSQNTDTASLLYDFINQCLSGKIDISLVTGKKQWIDKIDNQLDTNRLDKLEATTQRIDRIDIAIQRLDNRIDGIETITQRLAKRLDDWIEAFDDRLNDCGRELSEKMISLEHRINALSIQLDSQQDSQKIDTDSQEIDDMEPLLRLQQSASIADHSPNEPNAIEPAIDTLPVPIQGTDEPVETDSSIETGTGAIETDSKPWYTIDDLLDCHYPSWPKTKEGLRKKALTEQWPKRTRRGSKGNPYEYQAVLPSQGKD